MTLLGLGESAGPDGAIVVRHKKKDSGERRMGQKHTEGLLGEGGEGGEDGSAVCSSDDFEQRLALRLSQKEEEAAAVPDEVRRPHAVHTPSTPGAGVDLLLGIGSIGPPMRPDEPLPPPPA